MSTVARKDLLRFRSKADDTTGPDACWPWLAGQDKDGYGKFRLLGRHERAHRVAYLIANGPFDPNLQVLHRCDNPPCVNPDHLFLGTHIDNRRDCRDKGRLDPSRGAKNGQAKLTAANVRAIRTAEDRAWGWQRRLAAKHNVSEATVSLVLSRKVWAHV